MTHLPQDWPGNHLPTLGQGVSELPAGKPDSLLVAMDTGERIHFLDWGGRAGRSQGGTSWPPLVLLHDLSQTAWSWAPIARRLLAFSAIVAVDLRGHGLSEAPPAGYDLESLAADVLTVMSANGWGAATAGPAAVLVGHGSLGAAVAAVAAALQPQSVAGLALIDGGWEELAAATGMSASEYVAAIAEPPEVLASLDGFLRDRQAFDPGTWDVDQERAARAQVDEKAAGHVAFVARARVVKAVTESLFSYRPEETLVQVQVPLLVAVASPGGADDDTARERRLALEEMLRARAASGRGPWRTAIFAGAGHNLMRYRPEELSAELVALLAVAASPADLELGGYQRL